MTRASRSFVAWLCLSALLFLQLAVAAYACPTLVDGGMSALAAASSPAQPCAGMDQARPKLCEQHCVRDSQSVDTQPHSSVSAPVLPLMMVAAQPDRHRSTKLNASGTFEVTVVEPPPLVRFGVLRI